MIPKCHGGVGVTGSNVVQSTASSPDAPPPIRTELNIATTHIPAGVSWEEIRATGGDIKDDGVVGVLHHTSRGGRPDMAPPYVTADNRCAGRPPSSKFDHTL